MPGEKFSPSFKAVDTERGSLTKYAKNIQLSQYATAGSGTGSDPHILDLQDVFDDTTLTTETDLVVDGVFELDTERDVPAQYRFWGGPGRDDNDRGSVLTAASGFSGTSLVNFEGGPSVSQSNYGGAVGVFFDAASNADRCITTNTPGRNKWFRDCSFGNSNSVAVWPGGRRTAFYNCNVRDNNGWGLDINCQQFDWIGGRFASNNQDIKIDENALSGAVRLSNISFTNITTNPSVQIGNVDTNGADPEAFLQISHCDWMDFGAAVNGLKVGGSGDSFDIPIHLSNLIFDGNDRGGGATGNKAINAPCDAVAGGLKMDNITAKNFTNSPVVDTTSVNGADVYRDGTVEMSSTPSGGNWSADDAGVTIIDKSSTADAYDRYTVMQDGTLDGPF